jgi:ABC-type phosphate transport system substrate-binding protein
MKKLLCILLSAVMLLSGIVYAEPEEEQEQLFTYVSIECPLGQELMGEDYQAFTRLMARYADDKTLIPLSAYYDGYMYATVPVENAEREIEAFVSEEIEFTDDNQDFEYYIMGQLSAKGVITGDEQGRALPYDNVTRAEATAMVMRMLGLDASEDTDSGFDDVSPDEWYAGVITAARKYGIVNGDTEDIFNPERNVSREEIAVMAARGVWCAGLCEENKNAALQDIEGFDYTEDTEDISDWALSAYASLGIAAISDYAESEELDAEGIPITIRYFYPQKYATRFEISQTLLRIIENMQYYPSQTAIKYGFDKEMPIIDGSTSTYPFTTAVYGKLFRNGHFYPYMPKAHSKSAVSYQRLIDGEIDMIFASVYPSEEIKAMAAEKGVQLELIPIAYDAMIFFTNADNPATNLTQEQITQIYVNNAYDNWNQIGGPDALLYPYCRNNDSGSHAQMERHFLNGNEINEEIRNETTSISMANVLTDVMAAQTDDPVGYGLGYSIYYYFRNMDMFYDTSTKLKLLSIDGIAPTDETIADGSYPLSNNTYIVLRSDEPEDSPARRMAEFMLTEEGQECVEAAGFGRLK